MNNKDYYDILGIDKKASAKQIKKAYNKLAMEHHPDVNETGDDEEMKKITEAYSVLSDPKKREFYDTHGVAEGSKDFQGLVGFIVDLITEIITKTNTQPNRFLHVMKDQVSKTLTVDKGNKRKVTIVMNKITDIIDNHLKAKDGSKPSGILVLGFQTVLGDATNEHNMIVQEIKFKEMVLDFLDKYDFEEHVQIYQRVTFNNNTASF